jgi:6-pyruvoyltetrahydropterin/6-carboxytetrahydropterin synthase
MYELKIVTHFSAAHQLREFHGKCEQLHGHNWKIDVYVRSRKLDETGFVIDFGILKRMVCEMMTQLDHQFLNDLIPFKSANPSSENIAQFVANELASRLDGANASVSRVSAWESENACATYYPSPYGFESS